MEITEKIKWTKRLNNLQITSLILKIILFLLILILKVDIVNVIFLSVSISLIIVNLCILIFTIIALSKEFNIEETKSYLILSLVIYFLGSFIPIFSWSINLAIAIWGYLQIKSYLKNNKYIIVKENVPELNTIETVNNNSNYFDQKIKNNILLIIKNDKNEDTVTDNNYFTDKINNNLNTLKKKD